MSSQPDKENQPQKPKVGSSEKEVSSNQHVKELKEGVGQDDMNEPSKPTITEEDEIKNK